MPPPDPSKKSPSAIALDGQYDRVTGFPHARHNYKREKAILEGVWKDTRVTTAYLLRNASLLYGYIYKGPMKHTLLYGYVYKGSMDHLIPSEKEKWFRITKTEFIEKAALACHTLVTHGLVIG